MLEELERSLPRFRVYEEELIMTEGLERALSDEYTQFILFCAHAIAFFRNNPNVGKSRLAWSQFSTNFTKMITDLRVCSRRVDENADMIRLSRERRMADTISAIENMQLEPKAPDVNLPCYSIPYGLNLCFYGREAESELLKTSLDPQGNHAGMKVVSIYGLGGVGKTQLALHYANVSMDLYDVIAWISAESQIKITQAATNLATKLGLPKDSESEDDFRAIQKVRDWLNSSKTTFLLIFDNVEDASILDQIWPASAKGSVILTTRSPTIASKRSREVMHLECFTGEKGVDVFYGLVRTKPTTDIEICAAKETFELLGGLPLAMVHVSEFIQNRGYSYEEFLSVYKKSAMRIYARSQAPSEYNHSLSTVWEITLNRLSQNASNLQNLLAFFDPDAIQEWLLTNINSDSTVARLQVLSDEFE